MASPTKITEARRRLRKLKAAHKRKNSVANLGSTQANLALDKPNANEKKQAAARS